MTTTSILQSIANALACVAAHERNTWVCMGMALKSELGDAGFSLWDNWSQSADNYNARDSRTVWKSLRANGGVTIRSLYRLAMDNGWTPEQAAKPLSKEQRQQLEAEHQAARHAAEALRQQEQASAKARAQRWWNAAGPVNSEHAYLRAKGINPGNARQWRKLLLIPIYANHERVNLQLIGPDGRKRFLRGGQVKGGYCLLGKIGDAHDVLLCEGWATGASLYQASRKPVIVAFNAGNLPTVADIIKRTLPQLRICVAGDIDASGTGQQAAENAARIAHGCYCLPSFTPEQIHQYQTAHAHAPSDYNDLHQLAGLAAVKAQLEHWQIPVAQASDAPATACAVELLRADQITITPIHWLWPDWLAMGKLHILAGAPGTGKTTIAMGFAAIVSNGGRWPDGRHCPAGDVLIWSGEDDPQDTLAPRLQAASANLSRVHFIQGVTEGKESRAFDPARDIATLEAFAAKNNAIKLLVIDSIVSAVSGDSHKNTEVRRALQPLVDFGQAHGIAVVGITHFSKGTAGRDPTERVTGSIAFAALARVVLVTSRRETENGNETLLARSKSNIGPDHGGFLYSIQQCELPKYAGVFASYVLWGEAVEGSAKELLAEPSSDNADGGSLGDAKRFLKGLLEDGSLPAKTIMADADSAGYSQATIRRAQKALGILAVKEGGRFGREQQKWVWSLPTSACADKELQKMLTITEDAQQKNVSTFSKIEHLQGQAGADHPADHDIEVF